jgi:hypothetical protein
MTALSSADCNAYEKEIFELHADTLEQIGISVNREMA